MKRHKELPLKKYGRLTPIKFDHIGKRYRSYFLFRCDCGNEKILKTDPVLSGNTKSCGCLSKEVKRHSGKRRGGKRLPNNAGIINHIYSVYKYNSKDKGAHFFLNREEFEIIIKQECHYCGNPAGNCKKTKNLPDGFKYNGIDRVNPRDPYIKENVVPCCWMCNKAKGITPYLDFILWARKVVSHQNLKNN